MTLIDLPRYQVVRAKVTPLGQATVLLLVKCLSSLQFKRLTRTP